MARLLLGAQTEHEQRLTAVRLLQRDARFRAAVAAVLEPFEMFDADLAAEYGQALREAQPDVEITARRLEILERAFAPTLLDIAKLLYATSGEGPSPEVLSLVDWHRILAFLGPPGPCSGRRISSGRKPQDGR